MRRFLFLMLFMGVFVCSSVAKVQLPAIFSDNMVLQQSAKVNVWGKASPGELVSVKGSWMKQAVVTYAGYDGKWRLEEGDFKLKCGDKWIDLSCSETKVWETPNK